MSSASRLELNGTELLLLKWEMEGSTSALGYKFSSDLERADVRGDPDSQFTTNRAVSVLEQQGELRKILFWVEYPDDPIDENRYVQVRVYDDGHITVSQPVRPHLFDEIQAHINRLREYREYLNTLDELQDEFMRDAYRTESTDRRKRIRQQMVQSFERVLNIYFETDQYSDAELRVFQSIIANLGVSIIESGVPDVSTIGEVSETGAKYLDPEAPVENGVREFFVNYADYVHDNQDLDYELFVDHLHSILDIRKDLNPEHESEYVTWKKPLSVISEVIERYDIE